MTDSTHRRRRIARSASLVGFVLVALTNAEPRARAWTSAPLAQAPASQGYALTVWSIAEGMPQSSVNGVLQTDGGELWLATFGGLARFDGVRFRTLDIDTLPELPSHRMTAIVGDGADGMWISTQSDGLVHLRGESVVETLPPPQANREILSLALASDGSLWTRDSRGAVHRHEQGRWMNIAGGVGDSLYGSLQGGLDGAVWASSGESLIAYASDGSIRARLDAAGEIGALDFSDAKAGWIATPRTLERIGGDGAIERFSIEPPLQSPPRALSVADERHAWVGTRSGPRLLVREPGSPSFEDRTPADLGTWIAARCMLRDQEGNVWLGSEAQGLARLSPHSARLLADRDPPAPVSALAAAADGRLFIASECRGVAVFEPGGGPPRGLELPEIAGKPACIYALCQDSRGRLWMGADGRVLRLEDAQVVDVGIELEPGRVTHVVEDFAHSMWIASGTGRLHQLDADGREVAVHHPAHAVVSITPSIHGGVWVGGDGIVTHLHADGNRSLGAAQGLPRGAVRDVLEESNGDLWLASYGGGLCHVRGETVTRIARAQGLGDASLTRILDDRRGRLWLLTNTGLVVISRDELDSILNGQRGRIDPIFLGPEAGIGEGNFGAPAGVIAADGALIFGTIRGAVRIQPAEFPANRVAPNVRIERFLGDGRALGIEDPTRVPPGVRRLRFDFTALSLSVPGRVHFRYRLEGFDPNWIDGGSERFAEYSALAPGSYALEVLARNEHGVWSEHPSRIEFVVQPTWWQDRRIQALSLVGGALLLFLAHRLRISAVHRRGKALLDATEGRRSAESRESRLREELAHIARVATAGELATSLAHEVNQPLAAIVANASAGRRLIERDAVDAREIDEILSDIVAQGERASEVIRRLREFLRKHASTRQSVSIEELVRATLPLVRRELEESIVRMDLELAPDLPKVFADPVQLQQVLVNLIKNACEAFADSPLPRRIVVFASRSPQGVLIRVSDNGPGLDPSIVERLFEPYVTTKPGGMGLGLAICRTIVEAHGGRMGATPIPGAGVEFRVELPAQLHP